MNGMRSCSTCAGSGCGYVDGYMDVPFQHELFGGLLESRDHDTRADGVDIGSVEQVRRIFEALDELLDEPCVLHVWTNVRYSSWMVMI